MNGCCLTWRAARGGRLEFDLLEETLRRTNLGGVEPAGAVNLERALPANGRLGGHFVQGHVDCSGGDQGVGGGGADYRMEVELPRSMRGMWWRKDRLRWMGFADGGGMGRRRFTVWIIPHTREVTNLAG